jgi:hypothetical protein
MLKNLYVYLKLNLIFELETIHETGPKILEFGKKNAINGAIVF